MPLRRSSAVAQLIPETLTQGHGRGCNILPNNEALVKEICSKSRPGAYRYLQKLEANLDNSDTFSDLLVMMKDFKDKKIYLPRLIQRLAEAVHNSIELLSEFALLLPKGYRLGLENDKVDDAVLVTIRTMWSTVPIHVSCKAPKISKHAGLVGLPRHLPGNQISFNPSLKRKHSEDLHASALECIKKTNVKQPVRSSKRLKMKQESRAKLPVNLLGSYSPTSSKLSKSTLTTEKVMDMFSEALDDREKYQKLLQYRGEKAQVVLDTMQALVDVSDVPLDLKNKLQKALTRLSALSSLSPSCFVLHGLNLENFSSPEGSDGGFADIRKGTFHGQPLCVKIVRLIRQREIEKLVKAFWKEGVLWGQIDHPNILPFYGIYRLHDRYNRISLVSPWLDNGSIVEYLTRHPDVNRLLLAFDIVQGIEYLHKQGIVHGDLKGPNILVKNSGRACIADFGLATLQCDAFHWMSMRSTVISGTPRWQAPEILGASDTEEDKPTQASDIYAFACVMYEIYMGKLPFYEIHLNVQVIAQVILYQKRPTKPAPLHLAWTERGLTEEIWELIVRCWDEDPRQRYTADEIVQIIPQLAPGGQLEDSRPEENNGYLSPAAFRHGVLGVIDPLPEKTVTKVARLLRDG